MTDFHLTNEAADPSELASEPEGLAAFRRTARRKNKHYVWKRRRWRFRHPIMEFSDFKIED